MLNPVSSSSSTQRSDGSSVRPVTDPAVPVISRLDPSLPPDDGALAWLLAYGLPTGDLRRVTVEAASGAQHEPAVQQAWRHAQNFYGAIGGEGQQDERFAPPTGPQSIAALRAADSDARQVVYEALSQEFVAHFAQAMGVQQPQPGKGPDAVRADMKKVLLTAWLLDLPVDPKLAALTPDKYSQARLWATKEVFGLGRDAVRSALAEACSATLALLDADGLPDTDALKPDYQRAAGDLHGHAQACIARLERMKAD